MILCQIADSAVYRNVLPDLGVAIDWLMQNFDTSFVKGIYAIPTPDGREITVKCEEPSLSPREKVQLEAHRRFIDIHVPLKGTETIGWAPVGALRYERQPYDAGSDVAFYADSAHSMLHVKVGQMAIFFPDDAHAPNIGLGTHRKLCIKVPVPQAQ